MKKILFILIFISILLSGCFSYVARYDSSYGGKVIDADTREPIEGVVVLGTWYESIPTIAGAIGKFYDAEETVTDKNGEFSIPGRGLSILGNLESMRVLIFKAGYNYESGPWNSLKKYAKNIKWEGNKAIIPLKKLTMEERRKSGTFPPYPPTEAPKEKIKLMMEEIYKERRERGFKD